MASTQPCSRVPGPAQNKSQVTSCPEDLADLDNKAHWQPQEVFGCLHSTVTQHPIQALAQKLRSHLQRCPAYTELWLGAAALLMARELASLQPARSCLHRSRRLNCRHVRMRKDNTKEMNGGDGGGGKMNREIRKQMNGELESLKHQISPIS